MVRSRKQRSSVNRMWGREWCAKCSALLMWVTGGVKILLWRCFCSAIFVDAGKFATGMPGKLIDIMGKITDTAR